jgi:hypothetical protein
LRGEVGACKRVPDKTSSDKELRPLNLKQGTRSISS